MEWDIFISHAHEDKEEVARPLAELLEREGLAVWFDEFTLKVGDGLLASVDQGLAGSRFGVVILSPWFFRKSWTRRELAGLATRQLAGINVAILPVWHGVDRDAVVAYSPPLADVVAARTSDGLPSIVTKLLDVVEPREGSNASVKMLLVPRTDDANAVSRARLLAASAEGTRLSARILTDAVNGEDEDLAIYAAQLLPSVALAQPEKCLSEIIASPSSSDRLRFYAADALLNSENPGDAVVEALEAVARWQPGPSGWRSRDGTTAGAWLMFLGNRDALEALVRIAVGGQVHELRQAEVQNELDSARQSFLLQGLLSELAENKEKQYRANAAQAISAVGDETAWPGLCAALSDEHWPVRANALEALAFLRATPCKDRLVTAAESDADATVRLAADRALCQLGIPDRGTGTRFMKALLDPNKFVRHDAASSAVLLKPGGISVLREALRNTDDETRESAIFALAQLGRDGVPLLEHAAHSDPAGHYRELARNYASSIRSSGAPAAPVPSVPSRRSWSHHPA